VMYGPPGHAYEYFTYGMHYCVNLVCSPEGEASAVLLRAGRVIDGVPLARARRSGAAGRAQPGRQPGAGGQPRSRPRRGRVLREASLARGPALLCEALSIGRSHDGADVCSRGSELRVLAAPVPVPAASISTGPRVGVSRAAEVAWRFWIAGDPTVSAYRAYVPRRARAETVTGPEPRDGTIPG
jgi:DNA-3-methyladenine glycosylase